MRQKIFGKYGAFSLVAVSAERSVMEPCPTTGDAAKPELNFPPLRPGFTSGPS